MKPSDYPLYYWDIEQNSDEWDDLRLGKITASKAEVLTVKGKNRLMLGVGAITYLNQKASEVITGLPASNFTGNFVTERGHDLEHYAIEKYEEETFEKCKKIGFIQSDEYVGCSPDRLVGSDGLVEVKCPDQTEYLRRLQTWQMPKSHWCQIQFQLMVTGRIWCDYVLFNHTFKSKPIWINRIDRDEYLIKELSLKCRVMQAEIRRLVSLYG